MSAGDNKALARRFYEETDKGSLEAMDELVAELPPAVQCLGFDAVDALQHRERLRMDFRRGVVRGL